VPDPVCEPAQVEERHRELVRRIVLPNCEHTAGEFAVGHCVECAALVVAGFEREVRDLAARTVEAFRNGPHTPTIYNIAAALRATPGGEREEGGGRE
jgi:hypothetical protein